jgi:CO/xanthine dehydrogenase Mo-binding subunit
MSILGNWVPRVEDPRLLTIGGTYVGDVPLPDALRVAFVRATVAHGHLRGVDVTEAAERKLAALRCHASQLPDVDAMERNVRGWMTATAQAFGLGDGRLAESFRVVPAAFG